MTGPSERDLERRLNDLEEDTADTDIDGESNLSDEAAEALRAVLSHRRRDGRELSPEIVEEALAELDDELEEAYRNEWGG
jgi:hypothetical protein